MRALALLDGCLHSLVYVHVDADTRVISFRRASKKEGKHVSDAEHEAQKKRRQGERGKQVTPTKMMVTMRLSADVLEHFRATGPGWQTRIDEYLKKWVKSQTKRSATRVVRPAVPKRKKPTTVKSARKGRGMSAGRDH